MGVGKIAVGWASLPAQPIPYRLRGEEGGWMVGRDSVPARCRLSAVDSKTGRDDFSRPPYEIPDLGSQG